MILWIALIGYGVFGREGMENGLVVLIQAVEYFSHTTCLSLKVARSV